MIDVGVLNIVLSSSATVFGKSQEMPVREAYPVVWPTNSHGRSKLMLEDTLRDF
jgi:UDP-glucose 4-epimerase